MKCMKQGIFFGTTTDDIPKISEVDHPVGCLPRKFQGRRVRTSTRACLLWGTSGRQGMQIGQTGQTLEDGDDSPVDGMGVVP